MVERVDVLIAGTGFGGSIAAWRLAELYRAASADASSIVMLDRGGRLRHKDFRQSLDVGYLSRVMNLTTTANVLPADLIPDEIPRAVRDQLIGGDGAQFISGRAVGGGSNNYYAVSLRAPSETFERHDHRPDDGPDRRMWPSDVSRSTLDPYYARAEAGLRVARTSWSQVSKRGGLWAATLDAAGGTCDRTPLAIDPDRCVDANWCHTGCIFAAKNSLITNYLAAAEALGVQVRPLLRVDAVRQSQARPYRYVATASCIDPDTRQATGVREFECKVLILATGALNDPPILMRSRLALPSLSEHLGRHVGTNGDHLAAIEYDPAKVSALLGLPGYGAHFKGRPITTITYDYWAGRAGRAFDGTRFTLEDVYGGGLTSFYYDDGRDPGGDPSWWGKQKKEALRHWHNWIEILAMGEETNDGTFLAVPPPGGGALQLDGGPVEFALLRYDHSEQSRRVRESLEKAIADVAKRGGLGRFLRLTEASGAFSAHPLGGCRMAGTRDLGVTNSVGEVHGYEGLYCFGSANLPTSLGVNPSLTIAALTERGAERLVARAGGLGLPARPPGFKPSVPAETVVDRVVPAG